LVPSGFKVACFSFCCGSVGRVNESACFEPFDVVLVDFPALGLPVGFMWSADLDTLIPVDAQPLHGFKQLLGGLFGVAFCIGIFHAEDDFATGVAGPAPVEQGGTDLPHVWGSGWCRRKTYAIFGIWWNWRDIVRIKKLAHGGLV